MWSKSQAMIDSIDCNHFSEARRVKVWGSRGADEGNCGNMAGGWWVAAAEALLLKIWGNLVWLAGCRLEVVVTHNRGNSAGVDIILQWCMLVHASTLIFHDALWLIILLQLYYHSSHNSAQLALFPLFQLPHQVKFISQYECTCLLPFCCYFPWEEQEDQKTWEVLTCNL